MPITPDFFASHQWLRELRRAHHLFVAVDFVIDDDELVRVGHYSLGAMTAAEAAGTIMRADDPRGYEVVIMRKIPRARSNARAAFPRWSVGGTGRRRTGGRHVHATSVRGARTERQGCAGRTSRGRRPSKRTKQVEADLTGRLAQAKLGGHPKRPKCGVWRS